MLKVRLRWVQTGMKNSRFDYCEDNQLILLAQHITQTGEARCSQVGCNTSHDPLPLHFKVHKTECVPLSISVLHRHLWKPGQWEILLYIFSEQQSPIETTEFWVRALTHFKIVKISTEVLWSRKLGEAENKQEGPSLTCEPLDLCSQRDSGGLAFVVSKAAIYGKWKIHKSAWSIPFTQVFCLQQDSKSKSWRKGILFCI